jgi:hypothetical protein
MVFSLRGGWKTLRMPGHKEWSKMMKAIVITILMTFALGFTAVLPDIQVNQDFIAQQGYVVNGNGIGSTDSGNMSYRPSSTINNGYNYGSKSSVLTSGTYYSIEFFRVFSVTKSTQIAYEDGQTGFLLKINLDAYWYDLTRDLTDADKYTTLEIIQLPEEYISMVNSQGAKPDYTQLYSEIVTNGTVIGSFAKTGYLVNGMREDTVRLSGIIANETALDNGGYYYGTFAIRVARANIPNWSSFPTTVGGSIHDGRYGHIANMAFVLTPSNHVNGVASNCSPYSYFTVAVSSQGTAQDQVTFKSTLYAQSIQLASIVEGDKMPAGNYFVTRHSNYETIYYGDGTTETIYPTSCTWTHTWSSVNRYTLRVDVNYTETWYNVLGQIVSGPTSYTRSAFSQSINLIPRAMALAKANVRPGFVFAPRANWVLADFTLNIGLTTTFSATTQLTVGPNVVINSGNNITLSSPVIYLENGFWAQNGSQIGTNATGLGKRHIYQSTNYVNDGDEADANKNDSNLQIDKPMPTAVTLDAWPNPFNPAISICYQVPTVKTTTDQKVSLSVYNISGKLVNRLIDGTYLPGSYVVRWEASSQKGNKVPCGVYIVELKVRNNTLTKKIVFAK